MMDLVLKAIDKSSVDVRLREWRKAVSAFIFQSNLPVR
jgi:hypothetical protein